MIAELVGQRETSARGNLLTIQKSTIEELNPASKSNVQQDPTLGWRLFSFCVFVYVQYTLG